ncbi:hypothetical protein BDN72DRAFT_962102 [Pluteus cervinus]|uniref:Uncharacterized protein n=1 Tax=Pluteus cervinus TaxID=181527 RepID=A0ACD3AKW9_9AGAR|nr:hypothetical protein BDN72DRAFT_962102 [Pluteus cervinus]
MNDELEGEAQASSSVITLDQHLSFPTFAAEPEAVPHTQPTKQLLKDRLYVGNLHPTVDEYSLLQIFSKYGKVTKLDFLFHKTGALKGKPRGYAFIEYGNPDEAFKAHAQANDKLLRGRKLVVTYAHQAPLDQTYGATGTKHRKGMMEAGRPTALSILKSSAPSTKREGTRDKIALMEAKLRQLEKSKTSSSSQNSLISSSLPAHPSLPPKPIPLNPTSMPALQAPTAKTNRPPVKSAPPSVSSLANQPNPSTSATTQAPKLASKAKLVGVKFTKAKAMKGREPEPS